MSDYVDPNVRRFNLEELVPMDLPLDRNKILTHENFNRIGPFGIRGLMAHWREQEHTVRDQMRSLQSGLDWLNHGVPQFFKRSDQASPEFQAELAKQQKKINSSLRELESKKRKLNQLIHKLQHLLIFVPRVPPPPVLRPGPWFMEGNQIICLRPDGLSNQVVGGTCMGELLLSDANMRRSNARQTDPHVMHAWEFNYLMAHPDFAKWWMNLIEPSPQLNMLRAGIAFELEKD